MRGAIPKVRHTVKVVVRHPKEHESQKIYFKHIVFLLSKGLGYRKASKTVYSQNVLFQLPDVDFAPAVLSIVWIAIDVRRILFCNLNSNISLKSVVRHFSFWRVDRNILMTRKNVLTQSLIMSVWWWMWAKWWKIIQEQRAESLVLLPNVGTGVLFWQGP